MKIEHIAIWTRNLEELKSFYCDNFGAKAGKKYLNPEKQFESYFLTFDTGARLELMRKPNLEPCTVLEPSHRQGIAHIAFELESKAGVDRKAEQLSNMGITIQNGPRTTGDGYYEFVINDPDNNSIEIVYNPKNKRTDK